MRLAWLQPSGLIGATGAVLLAALPMCASAVERPVSLFAGYRVVLSPTIPLSDDLATLSYTLAGSAVMRSPGRPDLLFTMKCIGKEIYRGAATVSGEHGCVFIDMDGEQLRTQLDAAGTEFTFTLKGGTGKWQKASGRISGKNYQTPHDVANELLGVALGEGSLDGP